MSTNEAYMNLAAGRGTDGQGRDALGGRVTRQELELSLRMVFDTVVQMMRETVEERVGEVSDRIELVIQKQDQGFESLRYLMTATGKLNKEHINMAVDQKGLWAKIESVESELYDSIRNVEGNISNCRECVDKVDRSCVARERKLHRELERGFSRVRLEASKMVSTRFLHIYKGTLARSLSIGLILFTFSLIEI